MSKCQGRPVCDNSKQGPWMHTELEKSTHSLTRLSECWTKMRKEFESSDVISYFSFSRTSKNFRSLPALSTHFSCQGIKNLLSYHGIKTTHLSYQGIKTTHLSYQGIKTTHLSCQGIKTTQLCWHGIKTTQLSCLGINTTKCLWFDQND